MSKTTPMMGQYRRIRNEVPPETILFFRLGDFYEMFYEDAKVASRILDIALTKRQNTPMCGVPYHAAESYLSKLIKAGKKVAICDQVEDAAQAKGIVRREITRIVTPGTVLEESVLDANQNNYLAGLCRQDGTWGFALLDLSTGSFRIEEVADIGALRDNLLRYAPTECIFPDEMDEKSDLPTFFRMDSPILMTAHDGWTFDYDVARDFLVRHFKVHSLAGFGCEGCHAGISAAGAVLHYVQDSLRRHTDHVRRLQKISSTHYMILDESTVRNLDLVATKGERGPNLLHVLDDTRTPMGGRLIREWILRPLTIREDIIARHEAVDALRTQWTLLQDIRRELGTIRDMERLISRLSAGGGNGRDLQAVNVSLKALPQLKEKMAAVPVPLMMELAGQVIPLPDLAAWIDRALVDEPPITIRDGGMLRKGYHEELDQLRDAASEGRKWLADFQVREQERTGIKSLKVRHNKVFGYYIEVTKSNLDAVPEDYIRKQTLVNAERFITPELKEYENRIIGAHERAVELEYELFVGLREAAVEHMESIQQSAAAVAELDVLSCFAEKARTLNYVRPVISRNTLLYIKAGRHPVVEEMPEAERFVPNDTRVDTDQSQLLIITGPNMAGKSTYIRQVALIAIMAQAGCFVPAEEAEVGVIDRVFTRVGASDDLARGRSTFMVEMQETANILNNATPRSLIVLDEIGRGTSTFDGISIAWAVAEYLHNNEAVKAKTLFATHYHELTDLAMTMRGVKNYNILVREKGDDIAFLRKIAEGAADKSYGIQVARLAGLPAEVIMRSKEILANLEEEEFGETGQPQLARRRKKKGSVDKDQLSLF